MPSQDMVLGCYYLTVNNITSLLGSNHYFADLNDVILAYNQDQIEIHTSIWVRYKHKISKPINLIKQIKLKMEVLLNIMKIFKFVKIKIIKLLFNIYKPQLDVFF